MRPPINFFLLLLLLLASAVWLTPESVAQTQGACQLGTAAQDLDINNVRARVYNKGNLFFDGGDPNYEVPAGSHINSVFAGGIWIGGMVGDEIRMAAATYAQFGANYEFYPGPLNEDGSLPNRNDCTPYDRIYKVSSTDIASYLATGNATPDLQDWPTGLGAPTCVDTNEDGRCQPSEERVEATSRDQLINLEANQLPAIQGDQGLWWVMNDVGGPHLSTLSEPIGMEVRVLVFAFARADALGDATFYDYTFVYRGQQPMEETFLTIFSDPDLGNFNDDYIGSDPENGIGFVYNADNDDDGADGYGSPPPALGYDFFLGPITDVDNDGILDTLQMTKFGYFNNDNNARTGNPGNGTDYFRYGRGLWKDGTPWTEGGTATDPSNPPVDYVYPNSGSNETPAPGYWSEVCPTPDCGTPVTPADRRFLMSTGPFTMEPGETQRVVYGIVWARGSDNFTSLQAMKTADLLAQRAFDLDFSLAPPPPAPMVEATELNGEAIIEWSYPSTGNPSATNYLGGYNQVDPLIGGLPGIEDSTYTMQGFNVYRYPNANFFDSDRELIATYDVDDDITQIIDEAFDPQVGDVVPFLAPETALAQNTGLQFYHIIEDPLTNYQDYYYGVTAYAENEESTPKVLESPVSRVVVRPSNVIAGGGGSGAQADVGNAVTLAQESGVGRGLVSARVVDPTELTGQTYTVEFIEFTPEGEEEPLLTYRVLRGGEEVFNGARTYEETGVLVAPQAPTIVIDGLEFLRFSPPEVPEVDLGGEPRFAGGATAAGIVETSVPGELEPCEGVPTEPGEGYDPGCAFYGGNTVALDPNRTDQYFVQSASTFGALIEADVIGNDDFEMRFTEECATEGACLGAYFRDDGEIVSVPFELWNVRDVRNPDDDVRMIPLIRTNSGVDPVENWADTFTDSTSVVIDGDTLDVGLTERVFFMMPDRPEGYELFARDARELFSYQPGGAIEMYDRESDGDMQVDTTAAGGECAQQGAYIDFCYRSTPPYRAPIGGSGSAGLQVADLAMDGTTPEAGTTVLFRTVPKPVLTGTDIFTVNTQGLEFRTGVDSLATEALDLIGVVPNPYRGFSTYETGTLDRRVRFINLPDDVTIRIFTLSGTLIRTLEPNNTRSTDWDLSTETGLPVASGMYLIHVETPVGDKVLKLGVVNRAARLDVF